VELAEDAWYHSKWAAYSAYQSVSSFFGFGEEEEEPPENENLLYSQDLLKSL